jgi:acetyltransferase-like isoleucine patch superfamily enzyme
MLYQNALNCPIHRTVKFGNKVRLGYGVIIERDCEIGDNVFIGHYTILRPKTKIGKDTVIGHHTVIEGNTSIGDRVLIQSQCNITKGVIIEDDVFIAMFFCGANTKKIKHGRNFPLVIDGYKIRRAARIGAGVLLMPGVEIGENAQVGIGSLVAKNIPPREVWWGWPAKYKRDVWEDEIL